MKIFLFLLSLASSTALGAVFTDHDDRSEPSLGNSIVRQSNAAVATMIPDFAIKKTWFFNRLSISGMSLEALAGVCSDEPYSQQLAVGECSGVLIAPKILLTAGHCVRSLFDCSHDRWVFNFETTDPSALEIKTDEDSVYGCSKILASHYTPYAQEKNPDYALIELDRPVKAITPAHISKMSIDQLLNFRKPLFAITSPSGQPKKLSENIYFPNMVEVPKQAESGLRELQDISARDWAHETKKLLITSSFSGGSSGGPVFDASTGDLVGIVVATRSRSFAPSDGESYCKKSVEFHLDPQTSRALPLEALTMIQPVASMVEISRAE